MKWGIIILYSGLCFSRWQSYHTEHMYKCNVDKRKIANYEYLPTYFILLSVNVIDYNFQVFSEKSLWHVCHTYYS